MRHPRVRGCCAARAIPKFELMRERTERVEGVQMRLLSTCVIIAYMERIGVSVLAQSA